MDVQQPLVVQEDRMRRLLAYMWMASKTSCIPKPKDTGNCTTTVGRDPEFEAIIDEKASGTGVAACNGVSNSTQRASNSIGSVVHVPSICAPSVTKPQNVTVTTTQDLPGTWFRVNGESTRWKESTTWSDGSETGKVYSYDDDKPAVFNLTPRDVRHWRLAREAMDKYHLKKPNTNLDLVTIKPVPESMGWDTPKEEPFKWAAHLGFSLVAAGYGGLHALAWNAHFPTHRELKLWRISALIIATPAALYFLLILSVQATFSAWFVFRLCYRKLTPDLNPKPTEKTQPKPSIVTEKSSPQSEIPSKTITMSILQVLGDLAQALATNAICFLYFPARGYLVYESFRTVFFLPPEAYTATRWTQYLPHIT